MEIEDESRVVEAARRGDVRSFGRLYEHYYATMVWVAYSVLGDYAAAEDAAQEAFASACDELAGLRRSDRFGRWLAAICRNVACRMVRQRSREAAMDDPPAILEQDRDQRPEQTVREAIASLQQMHREVVVLYYYNGMSYEQIGVFLGIPKSKVKGRLFAARQKIGRYLQNKGLNGDELE